MGQGSTMKEQHKNKIDNVFISTVSTYAECESVYMYLYIQVGVCVIAGMEVLLVT